MTPTTLRAVGEALYGPRWQCELARELAVADRTIRRWAAGTSPIPDIRAELLAVLRARQMDWRDAVALLTSDT
jgi:hypothetical protein